MKAKDMKSSNGRTVSNQLILEDADYEYFQSYKSIIVRRGKGEITLDTNYWDYSSTTGKYRNLFLGEKKKDTQKKIDSGEYKLANLN